MKKVILKICLISCVLMCTAVSYTQNVEFGYDEAGNRISRLIVTKEAKTELPDSVLAINFGKEQNQNLENLVISVYPNPTSDILNIDWNDPDKEIDIEMYLFTINGELLKTIKLNTISKTIDMSGYSKGAYFLKIQMNSRIESWKIVKK